MWQKPDKNPRTRYHLIYKTQGDIDIVEAACGFRMRRKPELQVEDVFDIYNHTCRRCDDICSLVYTSIDDARTSLNFIRNVKIIKMALRLATGKALRKMLEVRIRKMEKAKKASA